MAQKRGPKLAFQTATVTNRDVLRRVIARLHYHGVADELVHVQDALPGDDQIVAILQPPKPQIEPSARILERVAGHDLDLEAAD